MHLTISTERGAFIKTAQLKAITAAIEPHFPFAATMDVFIAWAGVAKMRLLNRTWRGMDKPTNVLSYPQYEPPELKPALKAIGGRGSLHIGDIVLCLPYITTEAARLKKPLNDHLAHLVVHGVLHLLGYDHIVDRKATAMESLEKKILHDLGITDPYAMPLAEPKKPATKTLKTPAKKDPKKASKKRS